jgi:hypothetical protein
MSQAVTTGEYLDTKRALDLYLASSSGWGGGCHGDLVGLAGNCRQTTDLVEQL